jgi:beta-N-acetylhexosaminidase
MRACVDAVGEISVVGRERLERAMATVAKGATIASIEDLLAKRDALLALA